MIVGVFARKFLHHHSFAILIGVVDGILTSLILSAGRLTHPSEALSLSLGLRIACASALTETFEFLVADYSRLRGELISAEKQLILMHHGYLATTRLGRSVARDAMKNSAASGLCNFIGAMVPLIPAILIPSKAWTSIPFALAVLGILGVIVARSIYGNPFLWSATLILAGGTLAVTGSLLNLI